MKHKGCIMEIRQKTMVIMSDDCNFYEIEKRDFIYEGMEIEFDLKEKICNKKYNRFPLQLVAAAIILFLITSIYGLNIWHIAKQPVALITVDINPSVQMEVNNKNQVISTVALNKEAKNLDLSNLKDKNVRDALDIVLQEAREKGYIVEQEENYVLLTTVALNEDRFNGVELNLILQEIKKELADNVKDEGKIEIVTLEAGKDVLERAQKNSVSVGKLKIYEEIKEKNEDVTSLTALQEMRVKELIQFQNEYETKKEHPVFEEHPGNRNNDKQNEVLERQHPVFEEHPSQKKPKATESSETENTDKKNQNKENKESKEHPVFEEHPRDRKGETEKPHPVFEEHPGRGQKDKDVKEKE